MSHNVGAANPKAKLNEYSVFLIKKCLEAGLSHSKIAKTFDVSKGAIDHIAMGKTWKHVLTSRSLVSYRS